MITTESQDEEYRGYLAKGEVKLQKCCNCNHLRYPAQWICPECLDETYDWQEVSGKAVVETFTWYMQPLDKRFIDVPYNIALVQLDEGPRMITNVVASFEQLQIGMRVEAEIVPATDGQKAKLLFRPAA